MCLARVKKRSKYNFVPRLVFMIGDATKHDFVSAYIELNKRL